MVVSAERVASRYAMLSNPLDGQSKQDVMTLVKKLVNSARLDGVFHDTHWEPINRLWKFLHTGGVQHTLMASNVPIRDRIGQTSGREWKFSVEWRDAGGEPQQIWGVVTASGVGPAGNTMGVYNVSVNLKFPWG